MQTGWFSLSTSISNICLNTKSFLPLGQFSHLVDTICVIVCQPLEDFQPFKHIIIKIYDIINTIIELADKTVGGIIKNIHYQFLMNEIELALAEKNINMKT